MYSSTSICRARRQQREGEGTRQTANQALVTRFGSRYCLLLCTARANRRRCRPSACSLDQLRASTFEGPRGISCYRRTTDGRVFLPACLPACSPVLLYVSLCLCPFFWASGSLCPCLPTLWVHKPCEPIYLHALHFFLTGQGLPLLQGNTRRELLSSLPAQEGVANMVQGAHRDRVAQFYRIRMPTKVTQESLPARRMHFVG